MIQLRHYLYESISFHHQAKKSKENLVSTVLWLIYDFLSLKRTFRKKKAKKNLGIKTYLC